MLAKQSLSDVVSWQGKRALVRVDFNVPMDAAGHITDDSRIREALPTLNYLVKAGARVVLMSHFGRPKKGPEDKYRLAPVGRHLATLLAESGQAISVQTSNDLISETVRATVDAMAPSSILLLENTRFDPREEANDAGLAQALAQLADVFVHDAFGAAHRAHASTEGVAHYAPQTVAGLLMQKELQALSSVLESPQRPMLAIIGGSKVSTKITVLENLLPRVDTLVIGGGMRYTFFLAQGWPVGTSLAEPELLDTARSLLQAAARQGKRIVLSEDVMVADAFDASAKTQLVSSQAIPDGWMGMDIGPKTIAELQGLIAEAGTILWNGPLGVFEMSPFSQGTRAVAEAVAAATARGCRTILGGGDTVAAIEQFQIPKSRYTHVSTGGGASLEFLEGRTLPGVAVIPDKQPAGATAV
jgi:phosphoglycerate kinase